MGKMVRSCQFFDELSLNYLANSIPGFRLGFSIGESCSVVAESLIVLLMYVM